MNVNDQEELVQALINDINRSSPYKKKPAGKKKWMTVSEMGNLLGLKKTDRYWLLHKDLFLHEEYYGKIRINIDSFEKWYANQIKYHKVTGEEPGLELKNKTYSVKDISKLLGICESCVYDLMKKDVFEVIIVDYWKRIPKKSFWSWYEGQSHYRTQQDKEKDAKIEAESITMPEMARLLGIKRNNVYSLLRNKQYCSYFEIVVIGDKKRITQESFQRFLKAQNTYQLSPITEYKEVKQEKNPTLSNYRTSKLLTTNNRAVNGNLKYLTMDEAALLAKISRGMISKWMSEKKFSFIKIGSRVRIDRKEFEEWLKIREMEGRAK